MSEIIKQRTLKAPVSVSGVGLHTGKVATITIKPAPVGTWFVFKRTDLPEQPEIRALAEHVVDTSRGTTLEENGARVATVEHVLSALAGLEIDNALIETDSMEMPILDGSSKEWVELFKKMGYKQMSSQEISTNSRKMKFEPAVYLNGKTHLAVIPSDEFRVSYSVNYRHPELSNRWVELTPDNLNEIIEARTFGYLKELEMMQAAGFGRGATIDNTVGMTDDGYTTALRSSYEPAKHKILDLIGDFYLTGINPLTIGAQFIAKEAGHTVHVKTAKILKNNLK